MTLRHVQAFLKIFKNFRHTAVLKPTYEATHAFI